MTPEVAFYAGYEARREEEFQFINDYENLDAALDAVRWHWNDETDTRELQRRFG